DPRRGQWWFTPSSIDWLSSYIEGVLLSSTPSDGNEKRFDLVVIGAPTVAIHFSATGRRICCLDADDDVVELVRRKSPRIVAGRYDVADELPPQVPRQSASVVLIDPPWYQPTMDAFILRALEVCRSPGHLI